MMRMERMAATAWVMMAKYTPPTRLRNMALPRQKAKMPGNSTMASSVNARLLNGTQKRGRRVSWFQSMKSGMPGVDWMAVVTGSEASSFRYMAMQ
jgi:hypothetical protein